MTCEGCDDLKECIFNGKCPLSDKTTRKFVKKTIEKCGGDFGKSLIILDKAGINPCINCVRKIIKKEEKNI